MANVDSVPYVPGYRTLHAIGRGGMASVFLAVQQSVEREVALKIMSPHLSQDPTFGERFLREARIAAKLHHRHVVSIYDVGVHEGVHYCAMEYLPGGPVMRRNGPPLALKPAIRCVREIASALHYAQEKGFIHRDVKPDNILLREDGSCVLGDFGIARATDPGTIMTKTGSVVGTPHYMSPEQLRGRAIDGRADLYSLGVVFYQLLTGKVPYEASDSLAVGIMHMTAPLPQLPHEYRFLQAVLEKLLAKEPVDRFQTGNELDAALTEAENRRAQGLPPTERMSARREPETGSSTRKLPPLRAEGYDTQGAQRTEPQIGSFDDLDREPVRMVPRRDGPQRAAPAPPRPARTGLWIALLLLTALAAGGWWQRAEIARLLQGQAPERTLTDVELGDKALAAGKLQGQPGADALSYYTAALGLNGDDQRARNGLSETLRLLYLELEKAPTRDPERVASIVKRLQGVRGYEAELARFQALDGDAWQAPPTPVDPVPGAAELAEAQLAEGRGQLDGSRGALALYAAALAADPTNAQARKSAERVAAALAGQARSYLDAGNIDAADALRRELAAVPAAAALAADLQTRILAKRAPPPPPPAATVDTLLADARSLSQRGRLIDPRGASAADRYKAVLDLERDNREAKSGLDQALSAGIAQARAALERNDLKRAQKLAKRAEAWAPGTPALRELQQLIFAAEQAKLAPAPAQQAQIDALVREGEVAISADQLMEPPGDAAYDKFRGALAIDPRSVTAKAGMEALGAALRQRIEESLTKGRITRADGDVRALRTVAYRDPNLAPMSARVIRAYVERGLAAVAKADYVSARADLAAAESLDGADPQLGQLRAALVGH
jgi:serine/threonine protein kinase/tetratricopeptide (TPR) repeat protein